MLFLMQLVIQNFEFLPFKVAPSATVSCTDFLENHLGCVYWWEKMTCQVLIFSQKSFLSYGSFSDLKNPLTYCVLGFWQLAKFTEFAKFLKTSFLEKWWFRPFIYVVFWRLWCYFVGKASCKTTIYIILQPLLQYGGQRMRMLVPFYLFLKYSRNTFLPNFVNFFSQKGKWYGHTTLGIG